MGLGENDLQKCVLDGLCGGVALDGFGRSVGNGFGRLRGGVFSVEMPDCGTLGLESDDRAGFCGVQRLASDRRVRFCGAQGLALDRRAGFCGAQRLALDRRVGFCGAQGLVLDVG